MKGKIKKFNPIKGFGFIGTEEGDIFFHVSDFPELKAKINEEVEFETKAYKKGQKAIKIRRIKNGSKTRKRISH